MSDGTEDVRNEGHDDWIDALDAGDGYYLECSNGHGLLPPRRVCPHCGSRELTQEPLPRSGTVIAHTTVHVPAPSFQGDAPYTTAVAEFGKVRVTGQIRGDGTEVDSGEEVENGTEVEIDVDETGQGERLVVFRTP